MTEDKLKKIVFEPGAPEFSGPAGMCARLKEDKSADSAGYLHSCKY